LAFAASLCLLLRLLRVQSATLSFPLPSALSALALQPKGREQALLSFIPLLLTPCSFLFWSGEERRGLRSAGTESKRKPPFSFWKRKSLFPFLSFPFLPFPFSFGQKGRFFPVLLKSTGIQESCGASSL
jgi:hypothetical protein